MSMTADQRLEALARANQVRCANVQTKRMIHTLPLHEGRLLVAELLEDETVVSLPVGALPVGRLLSSINRLGRAGTLRLLRRAEVSSWDKRVRELTSRQRLAVARQLRGDE